MRNHRDERDITNSIAFYRKIFYDSNIGMSVYDASGQCIEANEAIGRLIGANREKVLLQNYYHIESWKKSGLLSTALSAIKENTDKHHEVNVTSTFGRDITIDYHMIPFTVADQGYLLLIASDATSRKKAEDALRESESKFRNLFDLSPQAISLTEVKNGELVDVNRKFCELTKYSKEEILGLITTEIGFYGKTDRNKFLKELQASGEVNGLEMDFRAKDNSALHALMFARIIQIAGVPFILTIFHDITEKKLLEVQLQRAEKMEAIGTLAGGVAHDLNNMLSGIVGYPDLLLMQIPEDSPLRKSILSIKDSGKRAAAIVQDLLTLARRGVGITEVVNLNDIILELFEKPRA